jgi:hypothetical protein
MRLLKSAGLISDWASRMSLNPFPLRLWSELPREWKEGARNRPVRELPVPCEMGRGAELAFCMRKETGGCPLRPFFFSRIADRPPSGAVLGLSALSSRNRGTAGAGAGSATDSTSSESRVWLNLERDVEKFSRPSTPGPLPATGWDPGCVSTKPISAKRVYLTLNGKSPSRCRLVTSRLQKPIGLALVTLLLSEEAQ